MADDLAALNSRKRQLTEGDTSEPDNILIKKPTKDLNTRVRLHVSNIPYEMKWQELKDLFREKIESEVNFVEIYNGPDGRPSGVGVVEVKNYELAQKAMHALHRTEVRGRMIIVREETEEDVLKHQLMSGVCSVPGIGTVGPKPQVGRPVVHPGDVTAGLELLSNSFSWQALMDLGIDPGNISSQVFVANLDYKVTTDQISELFRIAGNVINVELKLDKENKPRGMALVRYDHPVEALQAICLLNGQSYFDRTLIVRVDKVGSSKSQFIPHKLPNGLQSIGIGLGTNGRPLYDIAQLSNGLVLASLFGMLTRKKMIPSHISSAPALPPPQLGLVPGHSQMTSHLAQHHGIPSSVGQSTSASGINLETIIEETVKAVTNKLGGLVSRDTVTVGGKRSDAGMRMCGDITSQIHQMASYVDTLTGTSPAGFDYCNSLGYGANDYVTSVGAESPAVLAQKCSVYVTNLPLNYKWQSLKDKFKEVGEVVFADVKMDFGRSCPFGSVRFKTSADARKAVDKLNGSVVDGRRIEVRLV